MQEKKDSRIVISDLTQIHKNLVEGFRRLYETVSVTYGPKGLNAQIEKTYGKFMLTRDGVTVSRETYFNDRAINMGTQALDEASKTTNRLAGDGTSATVILGYHLLRRGVQAIAAGTHGMDVRDMLVADREVLLTDLNGLAKMPVKKQLQQVATVSSGDAALGQLIAEAIEHVGPDGGIITEKAYTTGVEREYVDGYYLQSGFTALQEGRKEITDPHVIVCSRSVTSGADIIDILTKTAEATGAKPGVPMRLLFVGNIDGDAYNAIVDNINRHVIDAIVIKTPPMFGEMGKQLLEDIAAYAGCEPVADTTKLEVFDAKYIGTVHKVRASKLESTLFADKLTEMAKLRIDYLKSQIKEEIVPSILEKLKDRQAKLEGKVALFKIGGATETTKEEVEFRVEDAINATRAAYSDGVVPGGGVTLLQLSVSPISPIMRGALRDTFQQLLLNANLPAEVKLKEALDNLPLDKGYDLRHGKGELVDMVTAGILDPKLVVEQVIINATQAAADALTTGVQIVFANKEDSK